MSLWSQRRSRKKKIIIFYKYKLNLAKGRILFSRECFYYLISRKISNIIITPTREHVSGTIAKPRTQRKNRHFAAPRSVRYGKIKVKKCYSLKHERTPHFLNFSTTDSAVVIFVILYIFLSFIFCTKLMSNSPYSTQVHANSNITY